MIDLETERLQFVQLSLTDASQLLRSTGNPEVMQYWVGGCDKSLRETQHRIRTIEEHWFKYNFGDWGIKEKQTTQIIGFAGLHFLSGMNEVNIGYVLEKSYWRKGYGFEICQFTISWGFEQLCLNEIVAVIWPENAASINLVQKCGFSYWKSINWGGSIRVVFKIDKP